MPVLPISRQVGKVDSLARPKTRYSGELAQPEPAASLYRTYESSSPDDAINLGGPNFCLSDSLHLQDLMNQTRVPT